MQLTLHGLFHHTSAGNAYIWADYLRLQPQACQYQMLHLENPLTDMGWKYPH